MIVVRLALGFGAVVIGWYGAARVADVIDGEPWQTLFAGLPVAAAFAYLLGQIQQVLHDPYREPLPSEEPSVLNPGPAAPALLGIGLLVLLTVACHSAAPESFDLGRPLGVLGGAMLVAQGRSEKPWVLEMNERAPLYRWIGMTAYRRSLVVAGVVVIVFLLVAPGEWLSSLADAFARSRGRRARALEQLFRSD